MNCRGRCFSAGGLHSKPVNHQDGAQHGLTWYFCPAHLGFHAMFLFRGEVQPLCGECAVLFFDKAPCAVWIRQYDLPATVTNAAEVRDDARADMGALLAETGDARHGRAAELDLWVPSRDMQADVLTEIPKHDLTYVSLGMTLIPHRRIPDMFLLEYRTFQGAPAYQPCSRNMDIHGLFKCLRPIDQHGDPVFHQARTWSCMVQAIEGLPKEVRWLLATMYNFCNEMLLPDTDEDTLWTMRPWLLHWYTVADGLFEHFHIPASTPTIDWFCVPKPTSGGLRSPSGGLESQNIGGSDSDRSSGNLTIIRRPLDSGDEIANRTGASGWPRGRHGSQVSAIYVWLASQPHLPDLDVTQIFDPTPRGYVSPRARRSSPPNSHGLSKSNSNGSTRTHSPGLNPQAAVFEPSLTPAPPPSPSSSERDPAEETDDSEATRVDRFRGIDWPRCSSPASSHWSTSTYCGEL